MMGPLFAFVAACLVAVATSSGDSNPQGSYPPRRPSGYDSSPQGYDVPRYPPRRNLYSLLAQAKARVANLAATDYRLNGDLDDVMLKINSASDFRVEFLEEIFPSLKNSMKKQDERIAYLTARLKEQWALIDEVNELSAKVKSILTNIRAARANHQRIISDLIGLENTEREQRIAISNITAEAAVQVLRLDEAEGKIEDNEKAGDRIYNKLIEVVHVVNDERAEVFYFDIDNTAPVELTFSRPFSTKVYFNVAIKGLHVDEDKRDEYDHKGYGKTTYNHETINTGVKAEPKGENNVIYGATVNASPEENYGWDNTVKYQACVVAYYIDNSVIENID